MAAVHAPVVATTDNRQAHAALRPKLSTSQAWPVFPPVLLPWRGLNLQCSLLHSASAAVCCRTWLPLVTLMAAAGTRAAACRCSCNCHMTQRWRAGLHACVTMLSQTQPATAWKCLAYCEQCLQVHKWAHATVCSNISSHRSYPACWNPMKAATTAAARTGSPSSVVLKHHKCNSAQHMQQHDA